MTRYTIDVPEYIAEQVDPLTARFIPNDSGDGKVYGLSIPAVVLGTNEHWFQMTPMHGMPNSVMGPSEADSIRDYPGPRVG